MFHALMFEYHGKKLKMWYELDGADNFKRNNYFTLHKAIVSKCSSYMCVVPNRMS